MEDGRVGGFGRAVGDGVLGHWGQLAAEARAAAARNGCGPPGGTARERSRLVRALSQARILRQASNDATVRFKNECQCKETAMTIIQLINLYK